jgi:catalase
LILTEHVRFRMTRRARRLGVAAMLAGALVAPAFGQAPPAPPSQLPQDLVNDLHAVFGEHHARAVHAKGIVLEGTFTPDKAAASLSKAPIFSGVTLPVVARFSDFTGIPDIPDTSDDANPRGFALKIKAQDGSDFDIVAHSFNGFPVATGEEFAVLLKALAASGPGVAHPTPIEQYLGNHPIAKTFLTTQKPAPVSYATAAYFGVNAFAFTNAKGAVADVRYRLVPRAGEHYLTPAEVKAKGPNYLREEITQRVAKGPVVFDWYVQIAAKGDAIANPSVAWPETRRRVKLGTFTITKVSANPETADRQGFLPGTPHPGIDAADPMLTLRDSAYAISFDQRQ